MMIDCQQTAKNILKEVEAGSLVALYDATDPSANSYVNQLTRTAKSVNIEFRTDEYSPRLHIDDIRVRIERWNRSDVDGIVFVSPSPEHYRFIKLIHPEKLVEGNEFDDNIGRVSCTARACVEIIKSVTEIEGKNILIIGYGKAVGKPLSYLLMRKHAGSVTTTHKYTKPIELFDQHVRQSDIIISAVGKPHFIHRLRSHCFCPICELGILGSGQGTLCRKILIDAGISIVDGKVTGDFDPELAEENQLSPVPGGVGPVTTALLLKNVSLARQSRF